MTENKRFKQTYVCGDYGLIDFEKHDDEQWIDLHSMGENGTKNVQICIDIMNDLADECKQLKKDRNELFIRERDARNDWRKLKYENEQLKSVNMEYEDALGRLEKENEELKQQVKSKERLIEAYEQYINDLKEDGVLE